MHEFYHNCVIKFNFKTRSQSLETLSGGWPPQLHIYIKTGLATGTLPNPQLRNWPKTVPSSLSVILTRL